jgi:hypothetical protein
MDNKQKPLSASTLKLYNGTLDKVKKCGIDIDNVDIEELKKTCSDNDFPLSKIKLINSSLLWYSKNNNKNTDIIELLHKNVKDDIKEHKYKYMNNELFENEIDKYIEWETIMHIYNKLEELCNLNEENENIYEEYLILSLYILIPPRRIEDYLYMKITDNMLERDKDCILWEDNDKNNKYDYDKVKTIKEKDDNSNYFIMKENESFLLFNKFKTKKYYFSQMLEVPVKLDKIIKKFIDIKKIGINDNIFNCSKTSFVLKINKIFERYIGKKISVNIIRHSRITNELKNNKITENYKHILSQKMAHAITTQSLYKKNIDTDSEDEKEKNNIEKININAEDILINHETIMKPQMGRKKKYNSEIERKEARKEAKRKFLNKKKLIQDE